MPFFFYCRSGAAPLPPGSAVVMLPAGTTTFNSSCRFRFASPPASTT